MYNFGDIEKLEKELYCVNILFMKRYNFLKEFDFNIFMKDPLINRYLLKEKINNAALIIMDMQNIFCSPISKHFIPSTVSIINRINLLIKHFEILSMPIVFTKHINTVENANMMKKRYKKLIEKNNIESELIDIYKNNKNIIEKGQFNAFYNSDLENILKGNSVSTLIITGIMSERCVSTTAREAFVRDYRVILPIDAITTYYIEVYKSSIISLANSVAEICVAEDIIEKLQ